MDYSDTLENAIAETKSVLQPLFVSPKLSSKLLSRPPFRFIHDILTATIRSTGFPDGLFSIDELDSSSFKESKAAKVLFLEKLIHLVQVGTGSTLNISSSKIIAGLEPLSTNNLLVNFGRLAQDNSIDRNSLIQHCLSGLSADTYLQNQTLLIDDLGQLSAKEPLEVRKLELHVDRGLNNPQLFESNRLLLIEKVKRCKEDINQTIEMISLIVKKPKCSVELLSKPPFRFIHDLVMAIGKSTGFDLNVIFSSDEMNSMNIKEKQSKVVFLEKLISYLEKELSMEMNVRPSKIISGQESEKTCYLLQLFTAVATTQLSATSASDHLKNINEVHSIGGEDVCMHSNGEVDKNKGKSQLQATEQTDKAAYDNCSKGGALDLVKATAFQPKSVASTSIIRESEQNLCNGHLLVDDARSQQSNSKNGQNRIKKEEDSIVVETHNEKSQAKEAPSLTIGSMWSLLQKTISNSESIVEESYSMRPIMECKTSPKNKEEEISKNDMSYSSDPVYVILEDEVDTNNFVSDEYFRQITSETYNTSEISNSELLSQADNVQRILRNHSDDEKKEAADSKLQVYNMHLRLNQTQNLNKKGFSTVSNKPAINLQELADAIQRITQLSAPLERFIDVIDVDMEAINEERNYWLAEQKEKQERLDHVTKRRDDYLLPLRRTLISLEVDLQQKLAEIDRLEAEVRKNSDIIKHQLDILRMTSKQDESI